MPEPMIRVENLGKCYRIHHQTRERYTALRDVIARKAKSLFHRASSIEDPASSEEDFWALKDVSFEVKQGDVVAIIGRNGAGKSTLLKILSRITEPTKGRITLNGRLASLLEVGTGFHPELTGRENIYLNGAILGMTKAEIRSKFDEIVAFAEVEKFLDTPVKRYSSGMYVRLAFAVAAHLETEILVIDEVLAVGDQRFQSKCLGKMETLTKEAAKTVIFVSHNLDAVQRICSNAILLENGHCVQKGSTKDIIEAYLKGGSGQNRYEASPSSARAIRSIWVDEQALKDGCLKAQVEFIRDHRVKQPTLGFVLTTATNQPLFGTNTLLNPWVNQPASVGIIKAEVVVDPLPLWSGTYHLSFWLTDGLIEVEQLSNAISFDYQGLVSSHFPINTSVIGCMCLPAKWNLL